MKKELSFKDLLKASKLLNQEKEFFQSVMTAFEKNHFTPQGSTEQFMTLLKDLQESKKLQRVDLKDRLLIYGGIR